MSDTNLLAELEKKDLIKATPLKACPDLTDTSKFKRIELDKSQIGQLFSQVPAIVSAGAMTQMYTLKFPKGVVGTLMNYSTGGYGSPIVNGGEIIGHVAFLSAGTQAAIMGAFTAMALVSGQYFMTQINKELKLINQKLDKILGFLYGDKKAELLSEISYTKRAFDNYFSIMQHDIQRVGTVAGLQQSGKVAIKDIEFYIMDIDNLTHNTPKSNVELTSMVTESLNLHESLKLSLQLYIMSSILEVNISQNYDDRYLNSICEEINSYVEKCNNRLLASFVSIKRTIESYKPKGKFATDDLGSEIEGIIEQLNNGETLSIRGAVKSALFAPTKEAEFIIDQNEIYYKLSEISAI